MKTRTSMLITIILIAAVFGLYGSTFAQEGKININTASMEELVELKHIGDAYAQRIIDFREKNGPFEKIEDIMKVKGIGEKIFEANKDRIIVE